MSLNGLDEAAIVEAHQVSLAEAGGWFLVKYASRDTVTLLSRGIGGVVEARLAIEQYEELSPLYGLVQYRRKKIILKYVPEGTTRLLQVRLSVQFQSVIDTFIPHDTIFSFTSAPELTESALSSACMLATRAGSMKSSSSSLRRRRLNEITEDAEEGQADPNETTSTTLAPPQLAVLSISGKDYSKVGQEQGKATSPPPPVRLLPEGDTWTKTQATPPEITSPTDSIQTIVPSLAHSGPATEKALPAPPQDIQASTTGGRVNHFEDQPTLRISSADLTESQTRESSDYKPRSVLELDSASFLSREGQSYIAPKKKKLGPRPHVETQSRPKTSDSAKRLGPPRPVANLPTSVQVVNRAPSVSYRPGSQQSSKSVPTQYINYNPTPLPPLGPGSTTTHIASLYRPPTRPTQPRAFTNPLIPTATPEKLRLMKALQLRKKNMMQAQRISSMSYAASERGDDDIAENPTDSRQHSSKPSQEFDHLPDPMSSTASPISMSHLSEKPSTQSSFTTFNDEEASRGSISSDTGSSVTPKADVKEKSPRSSSTTRAEHEMRIVELPKTELFSQKDGDDLTNERQYLSLQPVPSTTEPPKTTPGTPVVPMIEALSIKANSQLAKNIEQESMPDERSQEEKAKSTDVKSRGILTDLVKNRSLLSDPARVTSSAEASEASDDDSLMEELQHAKVEQAKPISVARSPATPIYSKGSSDRLRELSKQLSNPAPKPAESVAFPERPVTGKSKTGSARSGRSVSSNLPQWPPVNSEVAPLPLAKKGTLSSGISKRIKALEVFTSRDNGSLASSSQSLSQKTSRLAMGSFMRKSSTTSSQLGHAPNMSTEMPPPKELPKTEPVAVPENLSTVKQMPWVHRQGSETEISTPAHQGESISVTARIVRDNSSLDDAKNVDPSEPVVMNLYRSPLIVEQHEKHEPIPARAVAFQPSSFQFSTDPKSPQSERTRFSFTSHRSASQTRLNTSESVASRISMTSRKSNATVPPSMSSASSFVEEKKGSRTSRLKKRMSILSTGSRRTLLGALSPKKKENRSVTTIAEQSESPPRTVSDDTESMAHVVDIGDLNVQFPDTLLWKRRFMRIDDQGYVIFSPPAQERNPRGISRKFHLSDFRKPTLPDNEREEMLWSIKLEVRDGSCIQCACQSKYEQEQVLIMLVNAHAAYHSLYSHR